MDITSTGNRKGFTIVELLVVIVVIGILAAITIVSYTGITQKAASATLKSDLKNASTRLSMDFVSNGAYPATKEDANGGLGLSKSAGTTYTYIPNGSGYCLSATSATAGTSYRFDSSYGSVELGSCIVSWTQVSSGKDFICGVTNTAKVYCWGNNSNGQLGNNSTTSSAVPVAVDTSGVLSGKTIKFVSSGTYHACAIASDDNIYCWGANGWGQLGTGTTNGSMVPVAIDKTGVMNGKTIKMMMAGNSHSCVVASDNLPYCWGANSSGQLGDGTGVENHSPVAVTMSGVLSGKTIKYLSSADAAHTCVIASDDNGYCWGYNFAGQIGNGATSAALAPAAVNTAGVLSGRTLKSITVGSFHTCAVASDNNAYCWGYNSGYGQLGSGAGTDSSVPLAVVMNGALNGKTVKMISGGGYHTCAIGSDDNGYCWGSNSSGAGQLGNNSPIGTNAPVSVVMNGALNGKTLKSISLGYEFSCGLASDNALYCWGTGYGWVPVAGQTPPQS